MPRLLGIGDATVDIYLSEGMQYPGGNAVNVAVQAHRCGMTSSWLGCLGRDMLGDLVYGSLAAEGVDVSHVRRLGGPNPWSRIRHRGVERNFDGSNPGVRSQYNLGADDEAFIAAHDLVHTSVHSDLDAELPRLRGHARQFSYDYSEYFERPGATATMRYVDIAFLSAPRLDEAACAALLRWCATFGPALVVATRGAAGAAALQAGTVEFAPPVPTEVIDTLGAGDGFIAGFLTAHANGAPIAACLARGAAEAARVCTSKGGFGHGIPIVPGQPGLDPSQIVRRPGAQPAQADAQLRINRQQGCET
jgi:fructoselysine 6-kinase